MATVFTGLDHDPQRFLSAFEPIQDPFHPKQHQLTAKRYRQQLRQRFQDWREVAGLNSDA
ncbi:hypothetical protein [Phormidesmis priestleyi]|uniref:hypothetical protein n=1 Tax=Phormidesmis priestleyi TaxID=268141 RepID=UPI00083AA6EF|nr:hypothetical protein [Phormidesmis priestleyi]